MDEQVIYFSDIFQQIIKNTLTHLQGYHSGTCYITQNHITNNFIIKHIKKIINT